VERRPMRARIAHAARALGDPALGPLYGDPALGPLRGDVTRD
jgi:hypothetical protein